MNRNVVLNLTFLAFALLIFPALAHADVMGSLGAIKGAVGRIFPIVGMLGLLFAGFSFFMGSPNASTHLKLALIGAGVGFGAEPIVSFIDSLVN